MKGKWLILFLIGISLISCSQEEFSPGPKGPIGPQGDLGPQGDVGPQGNLGPSSEDAIAIKGAGVLVESEYPITGFSEIDASDFFDVEIGQGETYRVMVEADEAIVPYIDIVGQGKTLRIGLKNYTYNMENTFQRVEVTLPALTRACISNHTELLLRDIEADNSLTFEVEEFSELHGMVDANNIQVEVDNHSEITLGGSATQVTGDVLNHSGADLTGLEAPEVDVNADRFSTVDQ